MLKSVPVIWTNEDSNSQISASEGNKFDGWKQDSNRWHILCKRDLGEEAFTHTPLLLIENVSANFLASANVSG